MAMRCGEGRFKSGQRTELLEQLQRAGMRVSPAETEKRSEDAWTQRNGESEGVTSECGAVVATGTAELAREHWRSTSEGKRHYIGFDCIESQMCMKHPRRRDNRKLQT